MKEKLNNLIREAIESLGLGSVDFVVEHPTDLKMGDYSTNVGIKTGKSKEIFEALRQAQGNFNFIYKIEIAGPGFINFYLTKEFFKKSLVEIIEKGGEFGKNENLKGEKVMVEHTDPNPFKEFHIGHLMPNVIGSTIARIFEWNGAEVKQANYQGDVGMHVAKAIWGMRKGEKDPYVAGAKAYEENPESKIEIEELNKKIYEKSDSEINELYEKGRKESLEYFEQIYKK